MKCFVLVPKGSVAKGKLSQAFRHGAIVITIDGNFDDALEIVKQVSAKYRIQVVNSINPYRIEGQKTAAFEICDELGDAFKIKTKSGAEAIAQRKGKDLKILFFLRKSAHIDKRLDMIEITTNTVKDRFDAQLKGNVSELLKQ
jgi:hypothetical protein